MATDPDLARTPLRYAETELEEPRAPDAPDALARVPAMRVREEPRVTEPWAEKLVRLLDDGIRIPGTEIRFGLDAIIGALFPGAGDLLTGTGSLSLLILAIKHRVPTVVIGRMVVNIAIDTLFGSIPVAGDIFDFFFKANRKNLDLIEKYRDDPEAEPSFADYALVAGGALLILVSVAIPFLILALIGGTLWSLGE